MKIPFIETFLSRGSYVGAAALFITILGASMTARAQVITTYPDESDFSDHFAGPAYYEAFTEDSGKTTTSPQAFSFGGDSFTLSDNSTSGILYSSFPGQPSVYPRVATSGETFDLTFPSDNITAFGGNFFLTNSNFKTIDGGSVTVTAYSGTTSTSVVLDSVNAYKNEPFVGFTSTLPIYLVTVSGPDFTSNEIAAFLALDNLYLTQYLMVPEPSTWALLVGGLGLLAYTVRRRGVCASVQS